MIIAFDCDYTLWGEYDEPLYDNIQILLWFARRHHRIIVWSGGGSEHAMRCVKKLGLDDIAMKEKWDLVVTNKGRSEANEHKPDITFDDAIIELGKVNVRIIHPVSKRDPAERW